MAAVIYNVNEAETQLLRRVDPIPQWANVEFTREDTRYMQQRLRFGVRCADGFVGVEVVGDPGYRPVDPAKPYNKHDAATPCLKESKEDVIRNLITQLSKQLAIIELEKP